MRTPALCRSTSRAPSRAACNVRCFEQDEVQAVGPLGPGLFVLAVTVAELIPLFPTQPLALTAGLLFGTFEVRAHAVERDSRASSCSAARFHNTAAPHAMHVQVDATSSLQSAGHVLDRLSRRACSSSVNSLPTSAHSRRRVSASGRCMHADRDQPGSADSLQHRKENRWRDGLLQGRGWRR